MCLFEIYQCALILILCWQNVDWKGPRRSLACSDDMAIVLDEQNTYSSCLCRQEIIPHVEKKRKRVCMQSVFQCYVCSIKYVACECKLIFDLTQT